MRSATVEERQLVQELSSHIRPGGNIRVAALTASRSIAVPAAGRGAEFVACTPRVCTSDPDWFLDPKLRKASAITPHAPTLQKTSTGTFMRRALPLFSIPLQNCQTFRQTCCRIIRTSRTPLRNKRCFWIASEFNRGLDPPRRLRLIFRRMGITTFILIPNRLGA